MENNIQEILHDSESHLDNRDIWYNTKDPDFLDISVKSMVVDRWLSYDSVRTGQFRDSPIKPINNYVQNIATPPTLVSITGNSVRLRYHLYADMFLLKKDNKDLYHVDRTWIRQYYLTNARMPDRHDCFDETFKFFIPWFVEESPRFKIMQPSEESPFVVMEGDSFFPIPPLGTERYVNTSFVLFKIKNVGSHMVDAELGIPRRGDPIFDLEFVVSDIILERIEKYYAEN